METKYIPFIKFANCYDNSTNTRVSECSLFYMFKYCSITFVTNKDIIICANEIVK
jgi:hypothetical protein